LPTLNTARLNQASEADNDLLTAAVAPVDGVVFQTSMMV
jgi:hypothetical protein